MQSVNYIDNGNGTAAKYLVIIIILLTDLQTLQQACHTTALACANIIGGRYRYVDDLLQLSSAASDTPPLGCPTYHTPIRLTELSPYLDCHPDQTLATFIRTGLTVGFRIGFSQDTTNLRSSSTNHPSALQNWSATQDRITAEISSGRLFGPLPHHLIPSVHISPLGLVPKAHQPNKFRLITDLSSPHGSSVNAGISPALCSLHYASVDDAVRTIQRLGKDTELIKLDIKEAYRIVPVHPADYHLLGIRWADNVYIDRSLPFGLRSAPKLFNAVADTIAWVLNCHGIKDQLHYLDDFLFFALPGTQLGAHILATVLDIFKRLGIPVAAHKTEGPSCILVFLGILINTHTSELHLPSDKLTRLKDLIEVWSHKKSCSKQDLESFLGHLSHAATVISQGRTFLRQLFSLLSLRHGPSYQFIRLTAGAKADLLWWKTFLQDWNGSSFFPAVTPPIVVTSDASGSYGCGAFSLPHGWFQFRWPDEWVPVHITAKEMVPVVIAAALWGHKWKRCRVCFQSDNMAVVDLLKTCTSRDQLLMHLLRCLVFYAAYFRFHFTAEHVPGVFNTAADAISRDRVSLFLSLVPQIPQMVIPQPVVELLITARPNWGSQNWTRLFTRTLTRGLPTPPGQCTSQDGGNT